MKFENDAIDTIVTLINDDVEKYTNYKQRENFENDLIYANDNDGTEFDWENNNRLCEFVYWHKNGRSAMRCLVEKSGDIEVYIYPEGKVEPSHSEVHKGALLGYEVEDLYHLLMKKAELLECPKYDAPVQEIFKYAVEPSDIQHSDWGFEDGYFYAHPIIDGEIVTFSTKCDNDEYFAGWLAHFGVDDYDEYRAKVIADRKPDYCKEPESLKSECEYAFDDNTWEPCPYYASCPDDRTVVDALIESIHQDFGWYIDASDFIEKTEAGKALCQELADQINDYIEDYFDGEVTCVFVED